MFIVPPRSGSESDIQTTFNAGHNKAASSSSSSDIITSFAAAAPTPLLTIPQIILNGDTTFDNYESLTLLSYSDIQGVDLSGNILPYVFDNTGGTGGGSGGSGITILDEGSVIKTNVTELDILGSGVAASDGGGSRADITFTRVEETAFTNASVITITDVTKYPIFTVYLETEGEAKALFNSAMFNDLLFNDDELGVSTFVHTATFTATYDPVIDILSITLPSPESGTVAVTY